MGLMAFAAGLRSGTILKFDFEIVKGTLMPVHLLGREPHKSSPRGHLVDRVLCRRSMAIHAYQILHPSCPHDWKTASGLMWWANTATSKCHVQQRARNSMRFWSLSLLCGVYVGRAQFEVKQVRSHVLLSFRVAQLISKACNSVNIFSSV